MHFKSFRLTRKKTLHTTGDKRAFVGTAAYNKQAQSAMQTMDDIVRSLEDLDAIASYLRGLGARYAQYSMQPEHLDMIEKAFFALLQELSGPSWNDQLHAAWYQAVQGVKNVVVPALVQAHREANVIKLVRPCQWPCIVCTSSSPIITLL